MADCFLLAHGLAEAATVVTSDPAIATVAGLWE